MTLNNKKKKDTETARNHMIKVDFQAWIALKRARINSEASGNPRTITEIASAVICERLGAVNG